MRIVHITNNDFDGAGKAVIRLHQGTINIGAESIVIVRYKTINDSNVISLVPDVCLKANTKYFSLIQKLVNKFKQYGVKLFIKIIIHRLLGLILISSHNNSKLYNLNYSIIDINKLKSLIKLNDNVILHSTQDIIQPEYLKLIYSITKNIIIIHPLDIEHFTGGCHFNFGCDNYQNNCSVCPQLRFPLINKLSLINLNRKKFAIDKYVKLVVTNNYVRDIALQSFLYSTVNPHLIYLGTESNRYKQVNQQSARGNLSISSNDIIILFGCLNLDNPRKGGQILKDVIKIFLSKLKTIDNKLIDTIQLLTFGKLGDFTFKNLGINWNHLGHDFSPTQMNSIYRSANVLVNPSIDDFGPVIVQEAFMNDLPVISFNLGLAQDLIINGVNGHTIPLGNIDMFSNALYESLFMKSEISKNNKIVINIMKEKLTISHQVNSFIEFVNKN
jgi:glycosyltransferase involved in cell wall biosynthesis